MKHELVNPEVLVLPLTYRCNARCAMCDLGRGHKETIADEFIDKVLTAESLRDLQVVNITGGEPFLDDRLPQICMRMADAFPKLEAIGISTNGTLTKRILDATEKMREFFAGHKTQLAIEISLDGPQEVHDRVRGIKGAFDAAIATYHGLKESGFPLQFLNFGCNVNPMTVDTLDKVLTIGKALGAYVNFTPVVQSDLYFRNEKSDAIQAINKRFVEKATAFFDRLLQTKQIDEFYHRFCVTYLNAGQRAVGCVFRENGLFIDPDGDVYVCSSFRELKLGSMNEHSLDEILRSEKAALIRKNAGSYCARCGSNCMVYRSREEE